MGDLSLSLSLCDLSPPYHQSHPPATDIAPVRTYLFPTSCHPSHTERSPTSHRYYTPVPTSPAAAPPKKIPRQRQPNLPQREVRENSVTRTPYGSSSCHLLWEASRNTHAREEGAGAGPLRLVVGTLFPGRSEPSCQRCRWSRGLCTRDACTPPSHRQDRRSEEDMRGISPLLVWYLSLRTRPGPTP